MVWETSPDVDMSKAQEGDMDIEFKCKKCGQPLAIDEAQVGKEAKCPGCGTGFTVPTVEEAKAQATVPSVGGERRCPGCGAPVKPEAQFCNSCGSEMEKGTAPLQKKTSGLAIGSLICGILGFCTSGIASVPGLILGIVGLKRIKRSGGMLTGQGMAIAGIITSGIALVFALVAFAAMSAGMLLPAVAKAREEAQRALCGSNLKQIGVGCIMWAEDHDEQYPSSLKDLYPDYISELGVFVCPSTDDEVTSAEEIDEKGSYIYVSGLSEDSPPDAVLAYEREDNHGGEGRNVLFVDGHVEWVREDEFSELLNK